MIERRDHGSTAVLHLSHGKANTMDIEFCNAITDSLEEVRASSLASAILTSSGSIFSAGVDLRRLHEGGEEYLREFLPALERTLFALLEFDKPLVGAINGHAIAGGCLLAAGCDQRIMATGPFSIGTPELLVGVPFPVAALALVRRVVPTAFLREVVLSGRTYSPEEAVSRGFVDETCPQEELFSRALAAAEAFAEVPTRTFAITKRQLNKPILEELEKEKTRWSEEIASIWGSQEVRSAIAYYVEKTLGRKSPS